MLPPPPRAASGAAPSAGAGVDSSTPGAAVIAIDPGRGQIPGPAEAGQQRRDVIGVMVEHGVSPGVGRHRGRRFRRAGKRRRGIVERPAPVEQEGFDSQAPSRLRPFRGCAWCPRFASLRASTRSMKASGLKPSPKQKRRGAKGRCMMLALHSGTPRAEFQEPP